MGKVRGVGLKLFLSLLQCPERAVFLTESVFRWYFGPLKRADAERLLLMPHNSPGSFLVRDSESKPGDYSLTGRPKHLSCSRNRTWCSNSQ